MYDIVFISYELLFTKDGWKGKVKRTERSTFFRVTWCSLLESSERDVADREHDADAQDRVERRKVGFGSNSKWEYQAQ